MSPDGTVRCPKGRQEVQSFDADRVYPASPSPKSAQRPDAVQSLEAGRADAWDSDEEEELRAALAELAGSLFDAGGYGSLNPANESARHWLLQDYSAFSAALDIAFFLEQRGERFRCANDAADAVASKVQELLHSRAQAWISSSAQAPPLLKGQAAHATRTCRPCVFALRGVCKNSDEMCSYCHAPGHARTKRASLKVRQRKIQASSPSSPSPLLASSVGEHQELGFGLPGLQDTAATTQVHQLLAPVLRYHRRGRSLVVMTVAASQDCMAHLG
eukprot:CAMPEP_0177365560 /NCGR_PEP_ID=MMETSP0368-20130122/39389_1 /TAXON_ID=447022 ORGANISM="Scrippsiella hangoei-like, Strain SHHI-4" /NCGR_SAMPLE_ID=MMETSP0368 /ASSEMBLY_ACC=CAM_ASM_000363 /LENGTH=273 /DNA_ID=CAMNT_0018828497 /DNA_START=82 /DNA_END=904 /DNA_ORIENTATION=-